MPEVPCLFESFNDVLPYVTRIDSKARSQTKPSSITVSNTDAPQTLIDRGVSQFITSADTYLGKHHKVLEAMATTTESEPNRELRQEADVVYYARVYLLSPVIRALDVDDQYQRKIISRAEIGLQSLRVDLGIMYKVMKKEKIVTMIEFKKAGFISKEQYRLMTWNAADVDPQTSRPYNPDPAKRVQNRFSATKQLQQAMAYASKARADCRFVALCDYLSLVLVEFTPGLDAAHVTIVEEKDLRKALLGFLLKSIEES